MKTPLRLQRPQLGFIRYPVSQEDPIAASITQYQFDDQGDFKLILCKSSKPSHLRSTPVKLPNRVETKMF